MKKLTLLIICILFGIHVMAQQKCKDDVHPTENRKSILDCCIKEVKDGNVVVYSQNNFFYETEAVAVNFGGEFIYLNEYNNSVINKTLQNDKPVELYQAHDYEYYNSLYKKAHSQLIVGSTLGIIGVGLLTGGIIYKNNKGNNYSYDSNITGRGLITAGVVSIGVGLSITIVGGAKKHKYKNVMMEIERNAKLSFSTTNNGIGLVLKF